MGLCNIGTDKDKALIFFYLWCARVCRITKWKTANNMNVLHSCKNFSQTCETDILFIRQV